MFQENGYMDAIHRHISMRKLAEYITGELSLLKRVDVESHVAGCAHCFHKLTDLRHLITRLQSAAEPNVSVTERAVQMYRSRKSRPSNLLEPLRRVMAVLHFDSNTMTPSFGVRSGAPVARQLLFRAGANEIDLRIQPIGQMWTLSGQILGPSAASGNALLQDLQGVREVKLSELSEFIFTSIPAGMYRLVVSLTDADIELADIRVGS
jgi:anti-sigma factor RsiW